MNTGKTPLPTAPITASLLSKAALSARLGVSPRTIENMVSGGEFPPGVRLGKFLYWSDVSVTAWQQRKFGPQHAWRPK